MIFFPTIYEDELLYSAIARYHVRSGNTSCRQTLEDIFNKKNIILSIYLPSNIRNIINNMPEYSTYTEKELIYNNTLYPFFTAFMNQESANETYKMMLQNKNMNIHAKCGITARGNIREFLRFCPDCIDEDIKKYGETYWHRTHQIPEYIICSKHKTVLQDSTVEISRYNKYELVPANLDNCYIQDNQRQYTDKTIDMLNRLSINIEKLIQLNLTHREGSWFYENYVNRLKSLNLSSINGVVKQNLISNEIRQYYGDEFLKILNLEIDDNKNNWLKKILSSNNHTNITVKHLLIIDFLGSNIESIFNKKYMYEPFGAGPWPCLNHAQEHYSENTIKDISIQYNYRKKHIRGNFECYCGFKYSIEYSKTNEYDSNSLKNNLNDIAKNKVFSEIIKKLDEENYVIDEELGKIELIKEKKIISKKYREHLDELIEKRRIKYRNKWIEIMNMYPEKSKHELVNIDTTLASWLYKFDNDWLEKNSPNNKKLSDDKYRLDWSMKDEEFIKKVKVIVEDIQNDTKNPKRITKSRICKLLGPQTSILRNLDKIPKTKQYIENKIESTQQFRVRKIKLKIEDLINKGEKITFTKLLGGMHLNSEENKEIKVLIIDEL